MEIFSLIEPLLGLRAKTLTGFWDLVLIGQVFFCVEFFSKIHDIEEESFFIMIPCGERCRPLPFFISEYPSFVQKIDNQ